jgi:two-component system OmpR family sensor kinase
MHDRLNERWNAISLRTKMTGVSVFLLTLGLFVAGLGSMSVLRNYLTDEVDSKITNFSQSLNSNLIKITISTDGEVSCAVTPAPTDYFFAIYSATGQLMCANKTGDAAHPEIDSLPLSAVANLTTPFTVANGPTTGQWRVVANPVSISGSNDLLTVVVGRELNETNALVARFAAIFVFFGLTVVVLGGALTRLLVTSTFTPLQEVEATAARFAAGDFTQRMDGTIPNTEVGRLNRSLNAMLNRIDRAFADRAKTIDQMRRFVGDASHELRTPLVSVRGYAELYRMGAITKPEDVAQAMERIEKEAIRMGELVEDLLELARIDEAKPLQLAEVDLVPLARDAALDTMASSPDRVVTVVVTDTAAEVEEADAVSIEPVVPATPPATATGAIAFAGATLARLRVRRPRTPLVVEPIAPKQVSPSTKTVIWAEENKIRQVLTNLVGNARRFTPDGSPIEIGVEKDEDRGIAILSVIDHGEGIPPQIREKIFQRFWRADSSRNRDTGGSGLGLAIVASIVAAHKGEVLVEETPGGGATFRVLLPVLQLGQETPPSTPSA